MIKDYLNNSGQTGLSLLLRIIIRFLQIKFAFSSIAFSILFSIKRKKTGVRGGTRKTAADVGRKPVANGSLC